LRRSIAPALILSFLYSGTAIAELVPGGWLMPPPIPEAPPPPPRQVFTPVARPAQPPPQPRPQPRPANPAPARAEPPPDGKVRF
jgi:hypothetical protein